jgi:hypothetical protein
MTDRVIAPFHRYGIGIAGRVMLIAFDPPSLPVVVMT